MKRLILFFSLVFSLFIPGSVHAEENWVIDSFNSEINVLSDGKVKIIETINVDFGSLQKHGIYRDIPYVYTDSDGGKTYTDIDVSSVTDGISLIPYEESRTGGYIRIKIGDPDRTISGKQTYKIEYTAVGVLRSFDDHDELFWDVTGGSWPVPISQVQAVVTLPKGSIDKITCYEGAQNSTVKCQSAKTGKRAATFRTTRSLGANEESTIVVGYTKGLFPIITVPPPENEFLKLFNLGTLATFLITSILGIGLSLFLWWRKGRDYWWKRKHLYDEQARYEVRPIRAHEPIVVEYTPPENLRPAEVGTLIDERANTTDVTATIIDLASRGFLKIAEESKKWVFGSKDYVLTKIEKDTNALLTYEKELLDRLFDEGGIVKMSDLKREFYKDLKVVKDKLYEEMVHKKFFYENPESVRNRYLYFGIGVAVVGGIITFFLTSVFESGIFLGLGVGLLISATFLIIVSFFMPRKTAYGRDMYRRVRGYHLFVSKAEKYRQRFFEKKNMFNEALPYAIAFGVTEKFAKAFKEMGIEPQQPSWYTGSGHFNAAVFGASMASFSSSMGTAMASTPGGSGFSGGGAGGGFGGGGGGSW